MNPDEVIERVTTYLASVGIRVLDKDWRDSVHGTLPIVASDSRAKTTLVVVLPTAQAIPREMGRMLTLRMRKLAVAWMTAHGVRYDQVRIDYVSVTGQGPGGHVIEHVRGMG